MGMFGNAGGVGGLKGGAKQNERMIESLKLQLSEKTNEILRIREENETLRT
jgi:hypothetical protein